MTVHRRSAAGAALLAAMLLLPGAPGASAGSGPADEVALRLGQGLVALFPAVEGYVVSVNGSEAFVDLAEKDLVRPGMELELYRPGEQMVHPVSGKVLGSYEKALGTLRLAEVREKYSRGIVAEGAAGVAAGDRVRMSARRLRALLFFSGEAPGVAIGPLAQALVARGEESGRFTMIDEPAWASALAAAGRTFDAVVGDPAALRALGERAPADVLFVVRVGQQDGAPSVALTAISLRSGSALGDLREAWPSAGSPPARVVAGSAQPQAAAAQAAKGELGKEPAPPAAPEGEYTVRELSSRAVALAAGNILGEGRTEVLLSDGEGLALYRWEAQGLVWKWNEEFRDGRRVLWVDAADLDGDGKAEVLVSTTLRGSVRSEIRVWRGGKLAAVATAAGVYLAAAPRQPGRARLLGQRAGVGEVLTGRVEEYRWAGEAVEPVAGTALLRQAGIFGLALADAGGAPLVLSLDRRGYLDCFAPKGERRWRSGGAFGGYPFLASSRDLFGTAAVAEADFDDEVRAFQGRLLAESKGAGLRVLVPRNSSGAGVVLTRHRALGHGEIVVLEGTPTDLEEVRTSRPFDGYVADLAQADLDGDGKPEVLFVVNRSSAFLGERGRLVAWKAP